MKLTVANTSGAARTGTLEFRRGAIETPAFMPVGTYGTVKSVTPEEVAADGAEIILGNTFHLMLRPGTEVIRKHGGLHEFMNWHGPILTDSGGFQVFSLAAMRKLSEEGVKFQSPVNGDEVFLTPEKSMEVQHDLNADVTMIFDECTPYPASEQKRASRWRCRCAGRRVAGSALMNSRARSRTGAKRCSASCKAACTSPCARSPWRVLRISVSMVMPSAVWQWASPRQSALTSSTT